MTPLDIFMFPGRLLLELLFLGPLRSTPPDIVAIIAGIVSWIIWAGILRITWAITLKFFGFRR